MIDGIDGLLGGLSIVSFAAIGILMFRDGQMDMAYWSFGLIVAILPYLLLNLGIPFGPKYKVFMGDAGSTLIGFTIIWILLLSTQGKGHPMNPVTALWIIAVPLIDMVAIIYRPFTQREKVHSAGSLTRTPLNGSCWINLSPSLFINYFLCGHLCHNRDFRRSLLY